MSDTKKPRKKQVLDAKSKKTIGQLLAAAAAGFLPVASYWLAHEEVKQNAWLAVLVVAALLFSAPTLAEWATKWCKSQWKAWGFTILLEGVMVFSHTKELAITALVILAAINCHAAYLAAAAKVPKIREARR